MMDRIQKIKEEEFTKMNYNTEEFVPKTPVTRNFNPLTREIKSYQLKIFQKAIQQKNKPGYKDKEYETSDNKLESLKDDVFESMQSIEHIEQSSPFDFNSFSKEEKMNYVKEYIQRKNIRVDDHIYEEIERLLGDEKFKWSQFIHVSKTHRNISKITLLHKNELGEYNVCTKVAKKEKKFFI